MMNKESRRLTGAYLTSLSLRPNSLSCGRELRIMPRTLGDILLGDFVDI